ncbi:MAG: glucuronate isomerase [Bacteroidales bacterium]|nr:glucuronate isomerase [Bacteroidales bacterium]
MTVAPKPFMDKDFLLETPTGRHLYHNHAAGLPIIDYHCHLSPQAIAENNPFRSITELWLGGDHYKWRAMRANGVGERYITGDAGDYEKFAKWAETVPATFRNPLYHWTHMELRSAFGINDTLNEDSAKSIYDRCNSRLTDPGMTPRGLMERYGVEAVCTTDDPIDTLEHHRAIAASDFKVKVLPTWRPDKAATLREGDNTAWREYVAKLGEASGVEISDWNSFVEALGGRHDFFHGNGCRLADHGVMRFPWKDCTAEERDTLFARALSGDSLTADEAEKLSTATLLELCRMNHAKGWAQQFHFGPMRNVNGRAFRSLGPDTGFDTIGDYNCCEAIARFMDRLDSEGKLAKTILYNLNPADNEWVAAMTGNFQDGSVAGKIQMGSGWWFNDHIRGMEAQMNSLSSQGLLSRFVGMLTDSRSFLSYPRHDYFRRILCNLIGKDVDAGLIPYEELPRVEKMVEDICYYNAKRYFNL